MLKAGSGYLVECQRCLVPLGFVSTPRGFQSLRREARAAGEEALLAAEEDHKTVPGRRS